MVRTGISPAPVAKVEPTPHVKVALPPQSLRQVVYDEGLHGDHPPNLPGRLAALAVPVVDR
jgi:hypothetical protein